LFFALSLYAGNLEAELQKAPIKFANLQDALVKHFQDDANQDKSGFIYLEEKVRLYFDFPADELAQCSPDTSVTLLFFALPNGNSIEWTAGKTMEEGDYWRFDIQHIGAQTRYIRCKIDHPVLLVYLEADPRSWPTWRRTSDLGNSLPFDLVDLIRGAVDRFWRTNSDVILSCHSGGGSYLTGFINGCNELPDWLTKLVYLDANYSFSTEEQHHTKLIDWLERIPQAELRVYAYDDRDVKYNGKNIVSPTGGTYRASYRMIESMSSALVVSMVESDRWLRHTSANQHAEWIIFKNPELKILHTVMVGEWNGLIDSVVFGVDDDLAQRAISHPRLYMEFVDDGLIDPSKTQPPK
jgi:hypothetical protein